MKGAFDIMISNINFNTIAAFASFVLLLMNAYLTFFKVKDKFSEPYTELRELIEKRGEEIKELQLQVEKLDKERITERDGMRIVQRALLALLSNASDENENNKKIIEEVKEDLTDFLIKK